MPAIPALQRLRQGDCKFETSLGYTMRFCLHKRKREMGRWRRKKMAVLEKQMALG